MPSSTSSSDRLNPSERSVPRGAWGRAFVMALVLTILVLGAWEMVVRSRGYGASMDDTGDLWAANRTALAASPGRDAVIGSSRIQFDLDLDIYAEHRGREKPIQLALPGSKPLDVLEHMAADERFTGDLVVGVTPGLYFVPQGFPVDRSLEAIGRYENWSPSQRVGHYVSSLLNSRFSFINNEELTPNTLLRVHTRFADRDGTRGNLPPEFPPYFGVAEPTRQERLWEKCAHGSPLAQRIQQIWLPLFTPPPPPPHLTQEEFMAGFMKSVENDLERTRAAVAKLKARGCGVVFVRCPSSGTLREMENQFSPRPAFYDRIIVAADAPGIHFEDYPELGGFQCPEWSHLTAEDSRKFTTALMPLLAEALEASKRPVN